MLLQACADTLTLSPEEPNGNGGEASDIVMMSVGDEAPAMTRAISYMPSGVKFTSMMLVREKEEYDYRYEQPVNAYMIVDDKGAGNSLYYKSTYETPERIDNPNYNNDDDATIFYWQNRHTHGFIGYIEDYNKILRGETYTPKTLINWITNPEAASQEEKKTRFIYTKNQDGEVCRWQQFEKVDLRQATYEDKNMSQMPDPLIAYAEKKPEGSAAENNRVYLTFRHQLAQVQVNLRGSQESAPIDTAQIDKVELLGVSEYAYLFPYPEYGFSKEKTGTRHHDAETDEDGNIIKDAWDEPMYEQTWSLVRQGTTKELLRKAMGSVTDPQKYTTEQPYGTSFQMFLMSTPETNYLKSFNCVAFGNLDAIRITWNEETDPQKQADNVQHIVTFKITDAKFKTLESGKRYIFNLELQRGTLAIVRTTIDDWIPYTTEYKTPGTIVKDNGTSTPPSNNPENE